jgi:hypothetical protein
MVVTFFLLHIAATVVVPLLVLVMVLEDIVNLFDWTKNAIRNYTRR